MELKDNNKVLVSPELSKVSREEILFNHPVIGYRIDGYVKMNDEIYHMKTKEQSLLLNELVGEIISEYFDLQTKKSTIIVDEDRKFIYALIAKSFLEKGFNYCDMTAFTKVKHLAENKLSNLNRLQYFYSTEEEWKIKVEKEALKTLKRDLKKMIVRDFLPDQTDRGIQNFMFGYQGNYVKLMPLYDYEYSFGRIFHPNFFDVNLQNFGVKHTLRSDYDFQELLYKLIDFKFNYVEEALEKEHGIVLSQDEVNNFNKVIERQQRLVRENKLLK